MPSNKGTRGVSYWDELKLSFGSFIDMKLTTEQLIILFTFFVIVPKSGKRISMLSICRDKSLAHQDLCRPAPYIIIYGRIKCRQVVQVCTSVKILDLITFWILSPLC